MADIVLIHGSCFGAWCWHRLIPALNALGHSARAIDLPRGGAHPATASLQAQADAILASLGPDTLLLGHSAGGLPITAAAETDPSRIRRKALFVVLWSNAWKRSDRRCCGACSRW